MPQFRGESSLSSWLHRIVYTTAINHIRSHERRVRRDELGALRESGDDFAVETASRLDLEAALSRIPVDQRAALLLVDVQGFSYDDAARILGVAPGTVASRLSRARGVVRAALMTEREGA